MNTEEEEYTNTILQIQSLEVCQHQDISINANVLWDAGRTLSFITFELAGKFKLVGNPVNLEIVTVGGESRMINSNQYVISIRDTYSNIVEMEVLGIEEISTNIENIEISSVKRISKQRCFNDITTHCWKN